MLLISSGIFFPPNRRRTIDATINSSELPIISGKDIILPSNIVKIIKIVEVVHVIDIIIIVGIVGIVAIANIT